MEITLKTLLKSNYSPWIPLAMSQVSHLYYNTLCFLCCLWPSRSRWNYNPGRPLVPISTSTITIWHLGNKKELGQKTSLGEEAIDLLMHCPRDDKTNLYVNGMSGKPSLFWELYNYIFLMGLYKDPFDITQTLTSSSFLNSLSPPMCQYFQPLDNQCPPRYLLPTHS